MTINDIVLSMKYVPCHRTVNTGSQISCHAIYLKKQVIFLTQRYLYRGFCCEIKTFFYSRIFLFQIYEIGIAQMLSKYAK